MTSPAAKPFVVNTYSYTMRFSVRETIDHLADMGFSAFELMMYSGHLWPAETDAAARRELRRHIASRNLRLTTLNMPNIDINIAAAAPEMRKYSVGILNKIFELAGDLEAPAVIVGPGKANPLFPAPKEELQKHFFAALDALVRLSERLGVRIYVENMPFAFLAKITDLLAAVESYGAADVGVVYDLANAHFVHEDVLEGLRMAAPRLTLVHLSDTGYAAYRHDPVGEGSVPFAGAPAVLREIGYRELPALEIISPDPDSGIAKSIVALKSMGWASLSS
jgi:L-ribulose-5-phosphate 3-epimerase